MSEYEQKVHFLRPSGRIACWPAVAGSSRVSVRVAKDEMDVTCWRCLRALRESPAPRPPRES